ncbi:MAG: amidohydrolase [Bradymonadaceae bacterium]
MLLIHDTIYLDATGATTDALLIRDGEVVAIGDEAREERRGDERVVEPEAACLFPGLADAHCHLWGLGRRAGSRELSEADSWSEALEMFEEIEVDELPAGWVLGRRWSEKAWPDVGAATTYDWRSDLDRLFPDTPVCLHRVDHHAVLVNSEALRRAGYTDGAGEASDSGRAVREADGRLTGLLVDEAMDPVLEAIPPAGREEDRRMFFEAARQYRKFGITCAHIARAEIDRVEMVRDLHEAGDLPLRMYVLADGEDERLPDLLEEGPHRDPSAAFACRGVKFFADGALGSGGALLFDSYADGSSGLEVTAPETLREKAVALMDEGWQVACHAIGDRAVHHVLDAYAAADPDRRERLRPRLEHAQMMVAEDCGRIGELSTIASIQPIHMYSDAAWADEVLSDRQLDRLFRWKTLEAQTTLAGGSDFPIEDPNPWHGIATAISRRHAGGGRFRPDEGLGRQQALAAYTSGAAYAAHWEDRVGQLRRGFVGDVIALDRDPFVEEPESIWETDVLRVWG